MRKKYVSWITLSCASPSSTRRILAVSFREAGFHVRDERLDLHFLCWRFYSPVVTLIYSLSRLNGLEDVVRASLDSC